MHPGLDPGVGSSLEYEYSLTQFLPGDYRYVNWCDSGTILRPSRGERMKVRKLGWHLLAQNLSFLLSSYFWFPDFPLLWVLTVWPYSVRGGGDTANVCLNPFYGLVKSFSMAGFVDFLLIIKKDCHQIWNSLVNTLVPSIKGFICFCQISKVVVGLGNNKCVSNY